MKIHLGSVLGKLSAVLTAVTFILGSNALVIHGHDNLWRDGLAAIAFFIFALYAMAALGLVNLVFLAVRKASRTSIVLIGRQNFGWIVIQMVMTLAGWLYVVFGIVGQ